MLSINEFLLLYSKLHLVHAQGRLSLLASQAANHASGHLDQGMVVDAPGEGGKLLPAGPIEHLGSVLPV